MPSREFNTELDQHSDGIGPSSGATPRRLIFPSSPSTVATSNSFPRSPSTSGVNLGGGIDTAPRDYPRNDASTRSVRGSTRSMSESSRDAQDEWLKQLAAKRATRASRVPSTISESDESSVQSDLRDPPSPAQSAPAAGTNAPYESFTGAPNSAYESFTGTLNSATQTDDLTQTTASIQTKTAASSSIGSQTNVAQAQIDNVSNVVQVPVPPATHQRSRPRSSPSSPNSPVANTTNLCQHHYELVSTSHRTRQTQRSREHRERRDRQALAVAVVPTSSWFAWFVIASFTYKLRRQTHRRRSTLLRCRFIVQPLCRRFIDKLRAGQRLKALELLKTRPVAMPYDVGYVAAADSFIYRSIRGVLQREHPGSDGSPPHSCLSYSRGWCYHDSSLGETSWFSPDGSTALRNLPLNLPLKEWRLHAESLRDH